MICGKSVKQVRKTSEDRLTCRREKVNGVLEKSECEKEKNRRYQKIYRQNNPTQGSPKAVQDRSVALSSVKHLVKYKSGKYKRRCLKCEKKFVGVGAYNRICNTCSIENSGAKLL